MSTTTGYDDVDFDALVIGAGFGGLRAIYELKKQGLSVKAFEAGTDVGGTWYWNRYPGARTDSESWVYCFSFDDELLQDWDWPERFPKQEHVLEYLRHVADRFDLRKHIEFRTRVASAVYDQAGNRWILTTDSGQTVTSRYVITAAGILSTAQRPPFAGLDSFTGEWYQTSSWPKEPVDFTGKRVAVVGTGATAVQVIPVVAQSAASLTVFQRTPNYVMPGRNFLLENSQRDEIKRNYKAIWEQTHKQVFAFPMDPANRTYADVDSEQLQSVLEAGWEAGGFRYIFETFDDLLVDQRVNDAAADFVRNKIRAIVKDPETAELLSPKTHPIGGKRPPLGHFYYETFNKPNVTLVDSRTYPIEEITPTGIRTTAAEYEFDIIIFAVGFDAVTGPLTNMDIRGVDGVSIRDEWADGAKSQRGVAVNGFPNLFTILGPQGPFANMPPIIEKQVEFIGNVISSAEKSGFDKIEATAEGVSAWSDQCDLILNATLLAQGEADRAWFLGANIPGKTPSTLFYFGGAAGYFDELNKEASEEYPDFALTNSASAV
ncbi:NAD(P)/FAD-dependent oxidoreductase [soil metagenome]